MEKERFVCCCGHSNTHCPRQTRLQTALNGSVCGRTSEHQTRAVIVLHVASDSTQPVESDLLPGTRARLQRAGRVSRYMCVCARVRVPQSSRLLCPEHALLCCTSSRASDPRSRPSLGPTGCQRGCLRSKACQDALTLAPSAPPPAPRAPLHLIRLRALALGPKNVHKVACGAERASMLCPQDPLLCL